MKYYLQVSALQCMKQQREKSDETELPSNEPTTDNEKSVLTNLLRQPLLVKASPHHQVSYNFEQHPVIDILNKFINPNILPN